MLKVILAGYNLDTDVIENIKIDDCDKKDNITPETISAAYARISRDPRPVNELRKIAREEVDKARKSNENIVFKMGHHSVAEHAFLNFDILGISRLAVEYLEEARLCSYTEKSQRYITLEGDYVTPEEFDEEDKKFFRSLIKEQVLAYKKLFPLLLEYQKEKNKEMLNSKTGESTVEGWAKEDARYVLSLATECQLGFSANARNLEYIIRKLKYSPLKETRELGKALFENAKKVVPSLTILSDPEAFKKQFGWDVSDGFLKDGKRTLKDINEKYLNKFKDIIKKDVLDEVELIAYTEKPDIKILAALLSSTTKMSYNSSLSIAEIMKNDGMADKYFKEFFKLFTEYDAMPREFEFANFLFDIVISASAFAQLKRHRMMTILKTDYDDYFGYKIPPAICEINEQKYFEEIMHKTEEVFKKLKDKNEYAACYALTNAHKRRVLINVNLRELNHISRLRMDKHAQWDIRDITAKMVEKVKKVCPFAGALLSGKDNFSKIKDEFLKK